MPSHAEVALEAARFKLPVYLFKDGTFVPAEYDEKQQAYIKANRPLKPTDAIKLPTCVSAEARTMAREEILVDAPFKMHRLGVAAYEDFSCLLSCAQGRETFTSLYLGKHKISGGEETEVDGKSERPICRYPEPGYVNYMYVNEKGQVINRRLRKAKPDWEKTLRPDDYRSGYINVGMNTYLLEGGSIFGIRDYTNRMEQAIQILFIELKQTKDKHIQANKMAIIKRLASHCMGFADQAEFFGDTQAAEAARRIAQTIISKEEFSELSKQRLGPNGEMKITEKDLYHFDEKMRT
jgi:hypothetical protein